MFLLRDFQLIKFIFGTRKVIKRPYPRNEETFPRATSLPFIVLNFNNRIQWEGFFRNRLRRLGYIASLNRLQNLALQISFKINKMKNI